MIDRLKKLTATVIGVAIGVGVIVLFNVLFAYVVMIVANSIFTFFNTDKIEYSLVLGLVFLVHAVLYFNSKN